MERLLPLLILLVIGCQSDFKRVHLAIGATGPIERNLQPIGESLSYGELSYKEGLTFKLSDSLVLDTMAGPRLGIPLTKTESGVILGLETEAHIRLDRDGVQPYIGIHAGLAHFTEQWKNQGTNWGFTLGPVVGIQFGSCFIEYRYWHESNGTKVFGHNKEPNPGYNASMIGFGWRF